MVTSSVALNNGWTGTRSTGFVQNRIQEVDMETWKKRIHDDSNGLDYPINSDTLIFGGISTSIWIWSGHASACIIWTSFRLHNILNIFAMSCFNSPYITFLRNFGAKTIWYLQFHVVCDKLLLSTGHPPLFNDTADEPFSLYIGGFSFSNTTLKLSQPPA